MMEENEAQILLVDRLSEAEIPDDFMQTHFTHVLCHSGVGVLEMDGKKWTIKKNDLAILLPNVKVNDLMFSSDFKASFLLVSFDLMSKNNPDIGWGIKGYLFSKEHPVVHVNDEIAQKCLHHFQLLEERYQDTDHRFREELVNLQLQQFILEMWNVFADQMEHQLSNEKGSLFQRFLQLVQHHCMEHREVEFYAMNLNITPKYLSEICKKASGKNASEWIQNYTTTRLILLLKNHHLSFTEIADSMHFSSQSFFSRYVKKALGVSPSDYRSRLGN